MRNIQVIDGAENCVYDIFAITDEEFPLIFPDGQNVAFIDEVYARGEQALLDAVFSIMWKRPVRKADAHGIHGTIFFDVEGKKIYYPARRDEEAINPDGTPPPNIRLVEQRICRSPPRA